MRDDLGMTDCMTGMECELAFFQAITNNIYRYRGTTVEINCPRAEATVELGRLTVLADADLPDAYIAKLTG